MRRRSRPGRWLLPLAALAVATVALAACGSGGSSAGASGVSPVASVPTGSSAVPVVEQEWSITVNDTTMTKGQGDVPIKAGTVTFEITNKGGVAHALEIKGQNIDDKTAADIQPGQTGTLKVTLMPGKYEIWCPIAGHKEAGMDGFVTAS